MTDEIERLFDRLRVGPFDGRDPNATPQETLRSDPGLYTIGDQADDATGNGWAKLIGNGLYNGNFASPPPQGESEALNNTTNKLPYWSVTIAGGGSAAWVAPFSETIETPQVWLTGQGSGNSVTLEQIVPILTSQLGAYAYVCIAEVYDPNATSHGFDLSMQFLEQDGTTVGSEGTTSATITSATPRAIICRAGGLGNGLAPASATHVRIRMKSNGTLTGVPVTAVISVRLLFGGGELPLPDQTDTSGAALPGILRKEAHIVRLEAEEGEAELAIHGPSHATQPGLLDIQGSLRFQSLTPAQITANQNNYAPSGGERHTYLQLLLDANRTITGYAHNPSSGRIQIFANNSNFDLTLAHESSSSTDINRFDCGGQSLVLKTDQAAVFVYAMSRWRLISVAPRDNRSSWTPDITFATAGDLSKSWTVQQGRYWRMGDLVICMFDLESATFTHSTASGDLRITGLPFTAIAEGWMVSPALGRFQGITVANFTQFGPRVVTSQTYCVVHRSGQGQTLATVQASHMPSGGTVRLSGTIIYIAA